MNFTKELLEQIIFDQGKEILRFTQDSPVYPAVWLEYFEHRHEPGYRADLILTPHKNSSAAELFRELSKKLFIPTNDRSFDWELASSGDTVVVKLSLEELLSIALPLTSWWQSYVFDSDNRPTAQYNWLAHIVGMIQFSGNFEQENDLTIARLYNIFENLFYETYPLRESKRPVIRLWSVNLNRKATISIERSVPATKADAGRRLFDIDGSGITWAVMDSGIDARHTAFRKTDPITLEAYTTPMGDKADKFSNNTRIAATYDFTLFRQVLTDVYSRHKTGKTNFEIVPASSDQHDESLAPDNIDMYVMEITHALYCGRSLDWSLIAPLLRIPHNNQEYLAPNHPHGTHVAGIIAANQPAQGTISSLIGMCPGIELYDIRVMDEKGQGQEFNILAAIQFLRWLNNQNDYITIHGVNMSFSMAHEVASYACGQTPVCIAAERMVSDGTVVVAAAGNLGQAMYQSKEGLWSQGFRMVNITDPGNAERVITVGATHRSQPHTYGVSYFSSKGPTGDGRMKPDLVAPGEKIVSTSLDDGVERMDGTSMAAPHVSGAAALILAKHRELIGKPGRIKTILCTTATDLGREKYFQGCGMLDVLRAIQSV